MAQVWALPAAIEEMAFLPATSVGTREPASVPSCPRKLLPQQYARSPSSMPSMAQVCAAPAVMEVKVASPETGTGLDDMGMEPLVPSCPSALLPLRTICEGVANVRSAGTTSPTEILLVHLPAISRAYASHDAASVLLACSECSKSEPPLHRHRNGGPWHVAAKLAKRAVSPCSREHRGQAAG